MNQIYMENIREPGMDNTWIFLASNLIDVKHTHLDCIRESIILESSILESW